MQLLAAKLLKIIDIRKFLEINLQNLSKITTNSYCAGAGKCVILHFRKQSTEYRIQTEYERQTIVTILLILCALCVRAEDSIKVSATY